MILFPQFDLKDGVCVRLEQGDMARATVFHVDPQRRQQTFAAQGFEYLHVVDLDGAIAGQACQCGGDRAHPRGREIPIQLGGGIRNTDDGRTLARQRRRPVIIGTAAVRSLPGETRRRVPGRIVVLLSTPAKARLQWRAGRAHREFEVLDLARRFEDAGVAAIVHTDIARDGLLKGLNLQASLELAEAVATPVVVSGGLASIEDIKALLVPRAKKLAGAIAGRALYDGRLDAGEALRLIRRAQAP